MTAAFLRPGGPEAAPRTPRLKERFLVPDLFKTRGGFKLGASLISDENYASPLLILIFAKYLWRESSLVPVKIYKKSYISIIINKIGDFKLN
jgi:hypothetical protein